MGQRWDTHTHTHTRPQMSTYVAHITHTNIKANFTTSTCSTSRTGRLEAYRDIIPKPLKCDFLGTKWDKMGTNGGQQGTKVGHTHTHTQHTPTDVHRCRPHHPHKHQSKFHHTSTCPTSRTGRLEAYRDIIPKPLKCDFLGGFW